jgi:hypothetical protein
VLSWIPQTFFKKREYSFDEVSSRVQSQIKCSFEFATIVARNPFSFSGSDRNKGFRVQNIPDQSVNIFRIISFIEDMSIRFSRSVTLKEKVIA